MDGTESLLTCFRVLYHHYIFNFGQFSGNQTENLGCINAMGHFFIFYRNKTTYRPHQLLKHFHIPHP